ncbi:MAG: lamin tail domain-containing protein [Bacteroidales bacterium]
MKLRSEKFLFKVVVFTALFLLTYQMSPGQLYINEIMAKPAGTEPDWIEVYNAGNSGVDMQGKYLSDDPDNLTKWRFTNSTVIQAKSFYVVKADGYGLAENANFKLGSESGYVVITDIDGIKVIHKIEYKKQYYGVSYGLYPDGSQTFKYFKTASAGISNSNPYQGVINGPFFGYKNGFYSSPILVNIVTNVPGATIFYTTDGSTPLTKIQGSTKEYTTAIPVSTTTCIRAVATLTEWKTSEIKTCSYIFLNDVIKQPVLPDGFPANWGHTGKGDYEMDPNIVDKSPYKSTIIDDMKSIPTLSLVMDRNDWFGSGGSGIYIQGELDERAVSSEWISPDGEAGFQVNCGVMVVGGSSVNRWKSDKLSLRLKFKSEYESSKLRYPVFGEDNISEFNTLVLDARLNNAWHYGGGSSPEQQRTSAQYTRDQFICDVQNEMGGYAPRGRHVHLYINGLYWGMYHVHERPDEYFASAYLGGLPEHYDVLKHNKSSVVNGSNQSYLDMLTLADSPLDPAGKFKQIKKYLDIENFIDYMLLNYYLGNTDWAQHNWYATHNSFSENGRWRYHSWDAEHIMKDMNANVTNKDDAGGPTHLHQQLSKNALYSNIFANRVHMHFFGNGVFMPDNITKIYQNRLDDVDRAVVGESARWGDNQREVPYSRNNEWVAQRDYLLNTYFPSRRGIVLNQLIQKGWYPDLGAPYFKINNTDFFGGEISADDALEIKADKGQIYYTLNGEDPLAVNEGNNEPKTGFILTDYPSAKKVFVPLSDIGNDWKKTQGFDDSAWLILNGSPGGVGYEKGSGYESFIGLDVSSGMYGSDGGTNTSCYIRIPFTIDSETLSELKSLKLEIMCDDGFVAFLNETKIAEENAPASLNWNSPATISKEAGAATAIDVSSYLQNLVEGNNLLAIHGLNRSLTSSDFLIMVKLSGDSSNNTPWNINENAFEYSAPLTVNKYLLIKTRTLYNNEWSALNEIKVYNPTNLIISELNYHPVGNINATEGQLEFIELKNIGQEVIDLGTCSFTDGVSYSFPPGTTIGPDEFIVLASDRTAFENEYGFLPFDEFTGSLDNKGERLTLIRDSAEVIYDLRYDDNAPWPECADGKGGSLVPVNPNTKANYQQPAYWRCAAGLNGSPGEDDPDVPSGISERAEPDELYRVGQNYPNPFSDYTCIEYIIPSKSNVKVEVYSILGQKITELADEMQDAGKHTVEWDGTGQDGRALSDGIYFCRISVNSHVKTIRLILIK